MASSDSPSIDPMMLELFQSEMDTHIPALNEGLLALEKGAAGTREIEAMMRAAHSIKGAARIVGIDAAVRVAHVLEDCFTAAKESRITLTSDDVDLLLQGVDALQRICSPLSEAQIGESALDELLERLSQLKAGKRAPSASAAGAAGAARPTPSPGAGADAGVESGSGAISLEPEVPSLALPAVFDETSVSAFRNELLGILARAPARVGLDFVHVSELSASGLALLAALAREVGPGHPGKAASGSVGLAIESRRMCPAVRTVLRVAGLDAAFGVGR